MLGPWPLLLIAVSGLLRSKTALATKSSSHEVAFDYRKTALRTGFNGHTGLMKREF